MLTLLWCFSAFAVTIAASVVSALAVLMLAMCVGCFIMIRREKQGNPLFTPLLDSEVKAGDVEMRVDSATEMARSQTNRVIDLHLQAK